MRFMMLVKATKDSEAGVLPDEKTLAEMASYTEELARAGALLAGERLHASSQGVRVHYANGRFVVTDGPFAETKELIAGYLPDRGEIAGGSHRMGQARPLQEGEIELRPLFELTDFPVDPSEQPDGWREKEVQLRLSCPPESPERSGTWAWSWPTRARRRASSRTRSTWPTMGAFMEEGVKSGVFLSGEGLQPSSKGARIRYSGSQRTVTDGPFAETKELIAGYAILQFTSKAEAIEWTKRFVQVDASGVLAESASARSAPSSSSTTTVRARRSNAFARSESG